MTRVTISALAVLFGGVFAMGCAATPVPVLYDGLDQARYLRCTLVPEKQNINSSNFIGDGILSGGYRPGAPVVISMFSPQRVDLTLSGHTHGAQFGVEIPGIKWSPAQYRYKQWAGLYEDDGGQCLYVNRGFGFIGFPGRVGIWPEITVIELA